MNQHFPLTGIENEMKWKKCNDTLLGHVKKYVVRLCKTLTHAPHPYTQADRASPIHDVSEEGTMSWLTSDDKWTVGVMTMQDDHRKAAAT